MELNMRLEFFDEIYDYTKKVYINAGYQTIDDVLNASREDLLCVGFKNKNKPFRELQRIIHSLGLKFKYETVDYKNKLINENVSLWELDLSKALIKTFEKYEIFDSKALYSFIKNDSYGFYKICRNAIRSDYCYNGCELFSDFFDLNMKYFDDYENRYKEERKFYLNYKNEYVYLVVYFNYNDIKIEDLLLSKQIKDLLKKRNIYFLSDLLKDYYNIFIKDVELLNEGFYYNSICKEYIFSDEILSLLNELLESLKNNINYVNLKKGINETKRDIKNVLVSDLNLSENTFKRLKSNKIISIGDLLLKSKNDILNIFNCNIELYEELIYSLCRGLIMLKTNNIDYSNIEEIFELLDKYFELNNKKNNYNENKHCMNILILKLNQ